MDDREFILGYLAFMLTSYKDYKENTRDLFLSEALTKINNINDEQLINIQQQFKKAMLAAFDIFGENAFRKISPKTNRKFPVNKSLFESWSVHLSQLNNEDIERLKQSKQKLINNFTKHIDNNKDFFASISQAAKKVDCRFEIIEKIIQEVLS